MDSQELLDLVPGPDNKKNPYYSPQIPDLEHLLDRTVPKQRCKHPDLKDEIIVSSNTPLSRVNNLLISSTTSIGSRPEQQDRFVMAPSLLGGDISIFAVFDGTTGDYASEWLRCNILEVLVELLDWKVLKALTPYQRLDRCIVQPILAMILFNLHLKADELLCGYCRNMSLQMQECKQDGYYKWDFTASTGVITIIHHPTSLMGVSHVADSHCVMTRLCRLPEQQPQQPQPDQQQQQQQPQQHHQQPPQHDHPNNNDEIVEKSDNIPNYQSNFYPLSTIVIPSYIKRLQDSISDYQCQRIIQKAFPKGVPKPMTFTHYVPHHLANSTIGPLPAAASRRFVDEYPYSTFTAPFAGPVNFVPSEPLSSQHPSNILVCCSLTRPHKADENAELDRVNSFGGQLVYLHDRKPFLRGGNFRDRKKAIQLNYSRSFGSYDLKMSGLGFIPDIGQFCLFKFAKLPYLLPTKSRTYCEAVVYWNKIRIDAENVLISLEASCRLPILSNSKQLSVFEDDVSAKALQKMPKSPTLVKSSSSLMKSASNIGDDVSKSDRLGNHYISNLDGSDNTSLCSDNASLCSDINDNDHHNSATTSKQSQMFDQLNILNRSNNNNHHNNNNNNMNNNNHHGLSTATNVHLDNMSSTPIVDVVPLNFHQDSPNTAVNTIFSDSAMVSLSAETADAVNVHTPLTESSSLGYNYKKDDDDDTDDDNDADIDDKIKPDCKYSKITSHLKVEAEKMHTILESYITAKNNLDINGGGINNHYNHYHKYDYSSSSSHSSPSSSPSTSRIRPTYNENGNFIKDLKVAQRLGQDAQKAVSLALHTAAVFHQYQLLEYQTQLQNQRVIAQTQLSIYNPLLAPYLEHHSPNYPVPIASPAQNQDYISAIEQIQHVIGAQPLSSLALRVWYNHVLDIVADESRLAQRGHVPNKQGLIIDTQEYPNGNMGLYHRMEYYSDIESFLNSAHHNPLMQFVACDEQIRAIVIGSDGVFDVLHPNVTIQCAMKGLQHCLMSRAPEYPANPNAVTSLTPLEQFPDTTWPSVCHIPPNVSAEVHIHQNKQQTPPLQRLDLIRQYPDFLAYSHWYCDPTWHMSPSDAVVTQALVRHEVCGSGDNITCVAVFF